MDLSAIVGALIAGAVAASSEVASDAVKDAYNALKKALIDGYNFASAAVLDRKPGSKLSQQAVAEEAEDKPSIQDDPHVQQKAAAVVDALASVPPEKLAALGIDIKYLIGKRGIKATAPYIKGEKWQTDGEAILTATGKVPSSGK